MKSRFADYLIASGRIARRRLHEIAPREWVDHEPIGRLALIHGLLTAEDIEEILREQEADDCLFGEIAVRKGLLTPEQLDVLIRGQAMRACVELMEDMARAGEMDFEAGLDAIKAYISSPAFIDELEAQPAQAGW